MTGKAALARVRAWAGSGARIWRHVSVSQARADRAAARTARQPQALLDPGDTKSTSRPGGETRLAHRPRAAVEDLADRDAVREQVAAQRRQVPGQREKRTACPSPSISAPMRERSVAHRRSCARSAADAAALWGA
jgi:hypothetical protein